MTPRPASRGPSLGELILSLLLTTLAVLGLVGVVSYSLRAQVKSSQAHVASVIAATRIEDARVTVLKDFALSLDLPRQAAPEQTGFEVAVRETREGDDLKRVDVSVYWTDREGPQQYDLWTKLVREE